MGSHMRVLRETRDFHVYEEYEKTQKFCPDCGRQEVWAQSSMRSHYLCAACACAFRRSITPPPGFFGNVNDETGDEIDKAIAAQLLTGKIAEPTKPSHDEWLETDEAQERLAYEIYNTDFSD